MQHSCRWHECAIVSGRHISPTLNDPGWGCMLRLFAVGRPSASVDLLVPAWLPRLEPRDASRNRQPLDRLKLWESYFGCKAASALFKNMFASGCQSLAKGRLVSQNRDHLRVVCKKSLSIFAAVVEWHQDRAELGKAEFSPNIVDTSARGSTCHASRICNINVPCSAGRTKCECFGGCPWSNQQAGGPRLEF